MVINMLEIMQKVTDNIWGSTDFEVVRLIVVPFLSLITAIMAISVFSASYFIVFRIKKYLRRHKNYLNFTNKLLTSLNNKKVGVLRPYETTMWGSKLDSNKELIGKVLTQYKNADLKDLILGTYNDELKFIKTIINRDYKLINNNQNFLKFQRMFHKYTKETGVIIEYLDKDYVSFYKVRKLGVIIGVLKKSELESRELSIKYDVDYSELFKKHNLMELASIYQIYFIKSNFLYKNISNPIAEMEIKLTKMRKVYSQILKNKYNHHNVYLKDKFKGFPKLNKLLEKDGYQVEEELLLEPFSQRVVIDNRISASIKKRKEIKEVINYKTKMDLKNKKAAAKAQIDAIIALEKEKEAKVKAILNTTEINAKVSKSKNVSNTVETIVNEKKNKVISNNDEPNLK